MTGEIWIGQIWEEKKQTQKKRKELKKKKKHEKHVCHAVLLMFNVSIAAVLWKKISHNQIFFFTTEV